MSSSSKTNQVLGHLGRLRWLVGFLGSKKNAGWWDCSFMDSTGIQFLTNAFPRSAASAALQATAEAAQRDHDDALGRIGSYHLFRLPIQIEDRLQDIEIQDEATATKEAAMEELAAMADASIEAPEGPVQVGIEKKILTDTSLKELAAHYHSAISKGIRCYPYFSPNA